MALTISIFRAARFPDCTNGGISGAERGAKGLCLMNVVGPDRTPSDDYPPALLVEHVPFGRDDGRRLVRIVPAELIGGEWRVAPGWWMMGGNYGACSDSRFGEHVRELLGVQFYNGAVPIHDRREP